MRESIGSLEELILLAVRFLSEEAYGSLIRQTILEKTGRSISIGALYVTLERLEKKKLLDVELRNATPERGDKRRAYCRLTGLGEQVLDAAERARMGLRVVAE